jgi:hypothetical protein
MICGGGGGEGAVSVGKEEEEEEKRGVGSALLLGNQLYRRPVWKYQPSDPLWAMKTRGIIIAELQF